jgi:hypothetical protein
LLISIFAILFKFNFIHDRLLKLFVNRFFLLLSNFVIIFRLLFLLISLGDLIHILIVEWVQDATQIT